MIVDAQVHYDDGTEYCTAAEALAMARSHGVEWINQVVPETSPTYGNDQALKDAAALPDGVMGVFGTFDALAPDVKKRMKEIQDRPGIIGIRLAVKTSGAPNGLAERAFDAFFSSAQELDIAVEISAPYRVPEIVETVRRFPGVRVLLAHMGVERGDSDPFRQWPSLLELAGEPNVRIKTSNLVDVVAPIEKFPFPTAQRRFKELYDHAGSSKLIWASNYPRVLRSCTYREALDFVAVHCDFLSAADKDAILCNNFIAQFAPGR